MYEDDHHGIKFTINNESNGAYYGFIRDALDKKAQERLTDLYAEGFFMSSKNHPVRTIGIILSRELQLMLKITSPPKKNGITDCVYVEVCKFDMEQLVKGPSGKYIHLASR